MNFWFAKLLQRIDEQRKRAIFQTSRQMKGLKYRIIRFKYVFLRENIFFNS